MASFTKAVIDKAAQQLKAGGKNVYSGLALGWNKKAGRYQARRDMPDIGMKKGQFVANKRVIGALENYRNTTQDDMKRLAGDLKDKKIGLRDFEREMRRLIKQNERVAGVVGAGGAERFAKNKNFEKIVDANVKIQYQYLDNFVNDLRSRGKDGITARDVNRAGMYSLSSHKTMYGVMREAMREDADAMGVKMCEKRVLGDAEHCDDCVDYAAQCWQEKDVLPDPTQASQCGPNCRCEKRFTFIPIEKDCEDIPCDDAGNSGMEQMSAGDDNFTDLSDDTNTSEPSAAN